jgi:hypothetical protein
MKQGMSLVAMAQELERQRDVKRDFVGDTRKFLMSSDAKSIGLSGEVFGLGDYAEKQLAGRLDIPVQFYQRVRDKYPAELTAMVNAMFERAPQKLMVRTLDGKVRAFMSDGYRPLDNYDLFDAIYPALRDSGVQVESVALTETRLYIKALAPWLDRELPVPEGLKMGVGHNFFVRRITGAIVISNSEVGAGSLSIAPGVFERQCTNLAVFKDDGYGKVHIGKRKGEDGEVAEYFSDQTKRLEDAAVWAKARDVVKATLEGKVMDRIVAKLTAARGDAITGDPAKLVEVFAKKEGLTENERGGLLRHLTGSGEMTRYGLQWGVTRLAGEVEDYDRASELEKLGGKVIELPRSEWQELAKAA